MVDHPSREVCPRHEILEHTLARIELTTREGFADINKILGEVAKDMRERAVMMGELTVRVQHLERWVYAAMGCCLAGVLTAILTLAFKS